MSYFIIIRGPLGCGKSSISKIICEKLNAEYISVDKILEEHELEDDKEEGYISQKSFLKANEIAIKVSKPLLEKGKRVVFDGNFYWKSQLDDLTSKLKHPHKIFTLKAPLDVCIKRDSKRVPPHGKDATKAVYTKSTEYDAGINIDVTKPIDECIKDIFSYADETRQHCLF